MSVGDEQLDIVQASILEAGRELAPMDLLLG